MNILAIGILGAIGGLLRYTLDANIQLPSGFPLATLVINLIGSLAIGFLYFAADAKNFSKWLRSGISVGLIGGFTTFSSFSLDLVQLIHNSPISAAGYVLGTVIGGMVCVMIGELFAKWIFRVPAQSVTNEVSDVSEAEEAYL